MANKEFKIQSDTVSLNGVPLSSSSDGKVVIPGVTRATGYRVEEVNDTTDQIRSFQNAPIIIDYQIFLDYLNNGSSSGRAEYSVNELDGEGFIDGINVDAPGAYTTNESGAASRNDMWAYIGTAVGNEFNPFVDTDWDTIPFRPVMRSTGIESEFSGGGGGIGSLTMDTNWTILSPDSGNFIDFAQSGQMRMAGGENNQVQIISNFGTQYPQTWNFNPDGTMDFPDGTRQVTAYEPQVIPGLNNHNGYEDSDSNTATISVVVPAGSIVVLALGAESANNQSVNVVSVNGASMSWNRRTRYTDPDSPVYQTGEIWWSVNDSDSAVAGTVTIVYESDYDDQTASYAVFGQVDLNNPWTVASPVGVSTLDGSNFPTATFSAPETNTIALAFIATSVSTNRTIPNGFTLIEDVSNGGAEYWEYSTLSYNIYDTAQSNTVLTGAETVDPNANQDARGYTFIVDALVLTGPITTSNYTLPTASDTVLGGVKVDGTTIVIDGSGVISAVGGGGTSGYLYVMANIDGTVVTSTDGTNWTDAVPSGVPQSGESGIGKLEVHGGVIVYTRADVNDANGTGLYYSTVVGTATLCTGTDSFPGGNLYWREVHYFNETSKWVAVGYYNGGGIDYPILAHSTNGINWDLNGINETWANTVNDGNNWRFNDVAYNPVDNVYVIVGTLDNGSSGAFVIPDLTTTIDDTVWTSTPPNLGAIVYMNVAPYGPAGFMIATPITNTDEWTTYSPVLDHWTSSQGWYDEIAGSNFGYVPSIAEMASDGVTSIVTTNDGQVILRSVLFGMGPGLASIPLPYTSSISDIVRNQSGDGLATTIAFSGYNPANDGEKITISGVTSHTEGGSTTEQSYNGTYYIKTVYNDPNPTTYELYTDNSLTQPWDTSTYWPVDTGTGTLTWSHGQYLDAAGVAGSTFFVGNDDEQVFKSTDSGVTWTQVQDVSGVYFNDFAYGTFGSESTFAGDGALVLPLEDHIGYQTGYSLNGPTLKLRGVDDTQQVIITGPEPTAANRWAPRMVIQGQKGWGPGIGQTGQAGEGGDVYIWAGVGGESDDYAGDGGDIKVRAGQGQNSGNGGYVRIEGGDTSGSTGTGGFIDINAGNVRDGQGDGGDVNIRAGAGQGQGHNNGEVHVWTAGNSNHWVFKNDGTLQLPDGGLVNSSELTGNGYVGATGSKVTVYTNYQGYQGGESNGELVNAVDVSGFGVGDTITFRNGETRTITSFDESYTPQVYIQWDGSVEGSEFNPRFPWTITTSNYVAETKLTARIKPDSQTIGTGQYMDVYVGGPTVVDNKHVHMAGHDADTELFLGTDNNFVSAKEAGSSPARVNLKSENDITVSDTNLRMSRGNTWLSLYGDGENRNQHNSTYDLTWNVIETDDQGNFYVGGESCAYAEAMIAKYGPDGDLLWTKLVNGDDINGWQLDGVAYNPDLKEIAVAVQTNNNKDWNYYKINTFDSLTGDLKATFDLYDPDGDVNINNMTWHPTLGYVAVGYSQGEKQTSAAIPSAYTDYTYTTVASTDYELFITDAGNLPSVLPQAGDTFDYNGGTFTIISVNTYATYYGLVISSTVGDPGGNEVVLHRSRSGIGFIELPVAAVKVGGVWPDRWSGTWSIAGTNITGNQILQGGGPGLYQNLPVINLTNPSDTGLTVAIRVDYAGAYYEYYTTNSSGTGVWGYNDNFKILGSNLGGIDGGTNVSGTVDSMTQASANAYAFFTKVDHPDLYNQLNACSWTAQFNTNTYNVISCVENGAYWAVLLQDCTDLTPTSILFYTASGNDITGLVADLNGIQLGFSGTPNVNGLYHIDMGYQMGYGSTDFTGGTFTITALAGNRAFVWTNSWSKIYNPITSTNGTNADCVTVHKSTGDILVGARDNTNYRGFIWKLDNTGNTVWIKGLNDDTSKITSIAVSEVNGNIYYSTSYNSINKLSSTGELIARAQPQGPWGQDDPILKLEQGLDGIEYVYVAGSFGGNWTNNGGLLVSKLTSNFKLVWSRDFWNENRSLEISYDTFHNNIVLGRDKIVMVGYTYVNAPNNSNAYLASISTSDHFDPVQLGAWHVENPGGLVGYQDYTGDYTTYNFIDAGATTGDSSLLTDFMANALTWTNWAWKSTVLKLDREKGITGVESIAFAEGGELDHNPSDIPQIFTDFNSEGWNYTLKLSDRGKFIMNGQMVDNYVNDLYIIVPSNVDTTFPVGSVITLINVSDVNNNGYRIYIQPENYWGDSNLAPRIYASGFGNTWSTWSFQGIQTATLMKIGSNEWMLTANNIQNED